MDRPAAGGHWQPPPALLLRTSPASSERMPATSRRKPARWREAPAGDEAEAGSDNGVRGGGRCGRLIGAVCTGHRSGGAARAPGAPASGAHLTPQRAPTPRCAEGSFGAGAERTTGPCAPSSRSSWRISALRGERPAQQLHAERHTGDRRRHSNVRWEPVEGGEQHLERPRRHGAQRQTDTCARPRRPTAASNRHAATGVLLRDLATGAAGARAARRTGRWKGAVAAEGRSTPRSVDDASPPCRASWPAALAGGRHGRWLRRRGDAAPRHGPERGRGGGGQQ
jgi:hypothetical protein